MCNLSWGFAIILEGRRFPLSFYIFISWIPELPFHAALFSETLNSNRVGSLARENPRFSETWWYFDSWLFIWVGLGFYLYHLCSQIWLSWVYFIHCAGYPVSSVTVWTCSSILGNVTELISYPFTTPICFLNSVFSPLGIIWMWAWDLYFSIFHCDFILWFSQLKSFNFLRF